MIGRYVYVRDYSTVTIIGDRPVGPDGFTSQIVAGQEFTAIANVRTR